MEPFAREIIDRAQHAHDPSAADRSRVRAKLARRVGAGVLVAGGVAKASTTWMSIAKVLLPVIGVSAIVGVYAVTRAPSRPLAAAQTEIAAVAAPPTPMEKAPIHVETPVAQVEAPQPAASTSALAIPLARPRALAAPASSSSDLEAETLLLAAAQASVQRGDFAAALAKLDEHEKTYPNGVLVEERIATRVMAMCGAGRTTEARALGKTFLARYPRSPLSPRVKSSCATP